MIFFNYAVWFFLETYLTLLICAVVTVWNYFEIPPKIFTQGWKLNSRPDITASFALAICFFSIVIFFFFFVIFHFCWKKNMKKITHRISELYDGLNPATVMPSVAQFSFYIFLWIVVSIFIALYGIGDIKNPIAFDFVFITLIFVSVSLTLKYKIFESKIVMFSSLLLDSMLIILGTITVAEE